MNGRKRLRDGHDQFAIGGQRMAKSGLHQRNIAQAALIQTVGHPALRDVEHGIGESTGLRGMAIMRCARLNKDRVSRRTGMHRAVAAKALGTL